MSNTWKQWEGQVVNEEYQLLRYLGGSERTAVFLTEFREGERLVRAAIKLLPAGQNDEAQISRWRLAGELSHPHLISLFDGGGCELDGVPLLYVVMECAEENLAQVLPTRALTPGEAEEMLVSVLDVLAYLHGRGFVHGHIKPINIMASGDQLKLSSDGLCRTGESMEFLAGPDAYAPPESAPEAFTAPQTISPALDIWPLGITLVETMTQTLPVSRAAEHREPLVPLTLPEPFLDIARHCLVSHPLDRWSLAQISARLENRAPQPQAAAKMPQVNNSISQASMKVASPQTAFMPASNARAKRHNYGVLAAFGTVLALTAILVGPRLLRHQSEDSQVPAAALEQPPILTESKPAPQAQHEHPTHAGRPGILDEEQNPKKGATPLPASIHPEDLHEETNAVANLPTGSQVRGDVAQRVLPEVLESARNSIRGTVKVNVKVDVDRSGNVEGAELESRGPSKYFARAALQAAQLWKFKPARVGGRGVLSSWILKFEFTRNGTTVTPSQEIP